MSTKFEQLLDYLVNEEMDKANELFHEIVVEKSREIYENLIAEEAEDEEMDESADEEMDESADEEMDESADEDEEMDESADEEADESVDLEDSYMMDGEEDKTDDLGGDVGADDMGDMDDMGDDGAEKSEDEAIMDIKNAIAELEAAFADLQQAQGDEMGGDMGAEPAFGDDEADTDEMMGFQEGRRMTREYRETVGNDWDKNAQKTQGQIAGANTGDKMPGSNEGKSPISSGKGKPQTGADAKNILGKSATSNEDGTSPKGKVGGVLKSGGEFTKSVEKNISGSANAKMKSGSDLNKQGAGYPGNNKSAGPVGSGTGDKAGQTSVSNDKSLLKHIN